MQMVVDFVDGFWLSNNQGVSCSLTSQRFGLHLILRAA